MLGLLAVMSIKVLLTSNNHSSQAALCYLFYLQRVARNFLCLRDRILGCAQQAACYCSEQ
jgi:hypothetical protein